MLEGEYVVGGGDAGAAVHDGVCGGDSAEQGRVVGAQLIGREEAAIGLVVGGNGEGDGAGNMTSYGVYDLVLAAITVGGAGIHEEKGGVGVEAQHIVGGDEHIRAGLWDKGTGRARLVAGAGGVAGLLPELPAAIEHGDGIMPEPAQQPPEPGGKSATHIVIGDDLRRSVNAPGRQGAGEGGNVGQGMATSVAGDDRGGEVVVQVGIDSTSDVGLLVGATPGVGVEQDETAISNGPVGVADVSDQFLSSNQRCEAHTNDFPL